MQCDVCLASFDGSDFNKGAGFLKITIWYFVNALIVRASWNPFMRIKVALLRESGKTGNSLQVELSSGEGEIYRETVY